MQNPFDLQPNQLAEILSKAREIDRARERETNPPNTLGAPKPGPDLSFDLRDTSREAGQEALRGALSAMDDADRRRPGTVYVVLVHGNKATRDFFFGDLLGMDHEARVRFAVRITVQLGWNLSTILQRLGIRIRNEAAHVPWSPDF